MACHTQVPVWLAVAAPLLAVLISLAATTLVIEAGWLDAVCDGVLHGYVGERAAGVVETFWCDLRGAGREPLRSLSSG